MLLFGISISILFGINNLSILFLAFLYTYVIFDIRKKTLSQFYLFLELILFFILSILTIYQFKVIGIIILYIFIYLKFKTKNKEDYTLSREKKINKLYNDISINYSIPNKDFKLKFLDLLLLEDYVKIYKILNKVKLIEYDSCTDIQKDLLDFIDEVVEISNITV